MKSSLSELPARPTDSNESLKQNKREISGSLVLTGFVVDLIGCVLFTGEHAHYDSIITIFDVLLDLFYCLDLLGRRTCLLTHVLNNAWRESERENVRDELINFRHRPP